MVEFFLKFPLSDVNTWTNYNFKPVTGENFIKFGKTEMSVMGCMLAKIRLVRFFWGDRCYKTLVPANWEFTKFCNLAENI